MSTDPIRFPLTAVVSGRLWRLFSLDYTTADGEFSTYIYALSFEHANAIAAEIRESARIGGQLDSWMPAQEPQP